MGCVGSAAEHVLGGGRGVSLNNFPRRRARSGPRVVALAVGSDRLPHSETRQRAAVGVRWEREGGGAHPRVVAGSSLLIHLVHLQLSSTGLHRGAIAGSQRWRTEQHGRRVILQSIAAERHSGAVAVAGGAVAGSQRRRDGGRGRWRER